MVEALGRRIFHGRVLSKFLTSESHCNSPCREYVYMVNGKDVRSNAIFLLSSVLSGPLFNYTSVVLYRHCMFCGSSIAWIIAGKER